MFLRAVRLAIHNAVCIILVLTVFLYFLMVMRNVSLITFKKKGNNKKSKWPWTWFSHSDVSWLMSIITDSTCCRRKITEQVSTADTDIYWEVLSSISKSGSSIITEIFVASSVIPRGCQNSTLIWTINGASFFHPGSR